MAVNEIERNVIKTAIIRLKSTKKAMYNRIKEFNNQTYSKILRSSHSSSSSHLSFTGASPQLLSQNSGLVFFDLLEKLNTLIVDLDAGQLKTVMLNVLTLNTNFKFSLKKYFMCSLKNRIYFHNKGRMVISAKHLKDAIARTGIEIMLEGFTQMIKEKGGKQTMVVYKTHLQTIHIWQPFMNEVIKLAGNLSKQIPVDQINQDELALDAIDCVRADLRKQWI